MKNTYGIKSNDFGLNIELILIMFRVWEKDQNNHESYRLLVKIHWDLLCLVKNK